MKFRSTLFLVVASLLLGSFYLFYLRPRTEAGNVAAAFEKRFFRADARKIIYIKIENRDGVVEVTNGPGGWMIEKPQRFRPDEGMINKLLDTIASGKLIKIVGTAADLPQFGFDRPAMQLTLGQEGATDILVIGQKNPTDTSYYAYSEALGKIFLIDKELPKDLYLCLYDLREKRLFPFYADQVGRIIIDRERDVVDLSYQNGKWLLGSGAGVEANGEEVVNFIKTLASQKAVAFIPWEPEFKHLPKRARLQLFDRSGKILAVNDLYYVGTGENEGIVVYSPGGGEAARSRRDLWELLHLEVSSLQERHLFPGDVDSITSLRIVAGKEQFDFERRGRKWHQGTRKVDSLKMQQLFDLLRNWKGAKLIPGAKVSGKPHTVIEIGTGNSVTQLAVYPIDMSKEIDLPGMTIQTEPSSIRRDDVVFWLATATALKGGVLVGSHEIERLLGEVRRLP